MMYCYDLRRYFKYMASTPKSDYFIKRFLYSLFFILLSKNGSFSEKRVLQSPFH